MIDNNSNNDVVQTFVSSWIGKILLATVTVLTSLRYGGGLYAYIETEKLERPKYQVLERLQGGRIEIRRYEPYLIAETVTSKEGFQQAGREGFGPCAGYIFGKNKKRGTGRASLLPGWISAVTASTTTTTTTTGDGGSNNRIHSTSEKMAMTAPVRIEGVGEFENDDESSSNGNNKKRKVKPTRVSFVIGSNYTLQNAPIPLESDKVKIRQVPAHTLAVKTFSGPPPTDERVRAERRKLLAALQDANIDLPPTLSSSDDRNSNKLKNEDTLVYGYHDPFITPNFLRRNEVAVVLEGSV